MKPHFDSFDSKGRNRFMKDPIYKGRKYNKNFNIFCNKAVKLDLSVIQVICHITQVLNEIQYLPSKKKKKRRREVEVKKQKRILYKVDFIRKLQQKKNRRSSWMIPMYSVSKGEDMNTYFSSNKLLDNC